ncbi:MAG: DUF4149 domain-containing protein [Candidatus Kapaibacterium sp.]
MFFLLKTLALGVWLGALIMMGYAVAGPIFQHSPSKTLAGAINGVILGRMNTIEWVSWAVAFVCSSVTLYLNWNAALGFRIAELAMIAAAGVLLWFYSVRFSSRMETLRATIGDFDHPKQTTEYVQAKSEFDSLHHVYTTLVSTNMVLILSGFVLSFVISAKSLPSN